MDVAMDGVVGCPSAVERIVVAGGMEVQQIHAHVMARRSASREVELRGRTVRDLLVVCTQNTNLVVRQGTTPAIPYVTWMAFEYLEEVT